MHGSEDSATRVRNIAELEAILRDGWRNGTGPGGAPAARILEEARTAATRRMHRVELDRLRSEQLSVREEARRILQQVAPVRIARTQHCSMFDDRSPLGFSEEAVRAVIASDRRCAALQKIAGRDIACEASDTSCTAILGRTDASLDREERSLSEQSDAVIRRYRALSRERKTAHAGVARSSWYALPPAATEKGKETALPFRVLAPHEVRPFENAIPLYDLRVAAGKFSEEQYVDEVGQDDPIVDVDARTWVALPGGVRPSRDLFVAQVVGESMNRRIPNGAYCVFRLHPRGTRQGKVVLASHRDVSDADLGGRYTVKVYHSEKAYREDGAWEHARIILRPDTDAPGYEDIVFGPGDADDLVIIAELVQALGVG